MMMLQDPHDLKEQGAPGLVFHALLLSRLAERLTRESRAQHVMRRDILLIDIAYINARVHSIIFLIRLNTIFIYLRGEHAPSAQTAHRLMKSTNTGK